MKQKSPSAHHRTTLSGYLFATKGRIDNREKLVKQQCFPHMYSQYGELRFTSGWDLLASLRQPYKFQLVSPLGSANARHCSSGRQPNFAALYRGRHLYSAGRPSRLALAIMVTWPWTNKWSKYNRPRHRGTWTVQWYSPGGASVHST